VDAYCTYANDVMARSAHDRFISGRSSSEISNSMDNGISSSHIRYLSNIALKIHGDVHRNNTHKIRQCIGNYILGIDGTPDPDFSMIICVMDHLSGFTLFSERCDSESDESINNLYGDDEMILVIFGRNGSKFTQNHGNSRKRVDELTRIGMNKLISGQLTDNPYDAVSQLTNKNMG